ncbi:MAG TPA: membrane protein insertase YidC, partial [Myxococcota bacterium]|nr:membrane protein insertase YidC [Myxococcota bacterium]
MTTFNMVEAPQGPDPKRLLLAVIATSAVLMIYSYFFADKPSAPAPEVATKEAVKQEGQNNLPTDEPKMAHGESTKDLPLIKTSFDVKAKSQIEISARTSYQVEISNHGALIDRFVLTDFNENQVIFDQEKQGSALLKLSLMGTAPLNSDAPYDILARGEKTLALRHVTKQGLAIERRYHFRERDLIEEEIIFRNLSSSPLKVEPLLVADKRNENTKEPGFFNPGVEGQSITVRAQDKHQRFSYSDLLDTPKTFTNVKYVGFDDQFFLAAVIPNYSDNIDKVEFVVREGTDKVKNATLEFKLKPFVLIDGEEKSFAHQFFIGPKQVDLLASLPVPLDENVDFGWFGVLSRPMLWLLVQIYGFVQNYGLAIIIITFIIKLLTYPLTQKSFSSQQEMKKLQPKIKELQQKFGHDRTLLGQKQMELYRSHGINPVAGCLPLLIQLPIW